LSIIMCLSNFIKKRREPAVFSGLPSFTSDSEFIIL
jgi:hypothetical protein